MKAKIGSVQFLLKEMKAAIIPYMKEIWIALTAVCMGGWIVLLGMGGNSRYVDDIVEAIIYWASAIAVIGLGVFFFSRAAKIGRKEDKEKRDDREDSRRIMRKQEELLEWEKSSKGINQIG